MANATGPSSPRNPKESKPVSRSEAPVWLRTSVVIAICSASFVAGGCPIEAGQPENHAEPQVVTVAKSKAPQAAVSAVAPKASEVPAASAIPPAAPLPGDSDKCAAGMALVEGEYCPLVEQQCLEHPKDSENRDVQPICLRFDQQSKCVATKGRKHMTFCMDRFEYPNQIGEKPMNLVSWEDASKLCGALGKRMCTEQEFNFACEGEEMRPYATGYTRDPEKCNLDKPFKQKGRDLLSYHACAENPTCAAEMARIDQRIPIGDNRQCVSPFGVYDLNGNVNEWVHLPYETAPHRSGLKGGWWGPVRNRCRPVVAHHDEKYTGYEVGFRCCQDADGAPTPGKKRHPVVTR